jgi:hypothetical protein
MKYMVIMTILIYMRNIDLISIKVEWVVVKDYLKGMVVVGAWCPYIYISAPFSY